MKRYMAVIYIPANRGFAGMPQGELIGDPAIQNADITYWARNQDHAEEIAATLADMLGGSEALIDSVYELA